VIRRSGVSRSRINLQEIHDERAVDQMTITGWRRGAEVGSASCQMTSAAARRGRLPRGTGEFSAPAAVPCGHRRQPMTSGPRTED
jgi:hypothetical protein